MKEELIHRVISGPQLQRARSSFASSFLSRDRMDSDTHPAEKILISTDAMYCTSSTARRIGLKAAPLHGRVRRVLRPCRFRWLSLVGSAAIPSSAAELLPFTFGKQCPLREISDWDGAT